MARLNLKSVADNIAVKYGRETVATWETLRDYCDLQTYGDLDAIQLDILTDMVESRLKSTTQEN